MNLVTHASVCVEHMRQLVRKPFRSRAPSGTSVVVGVLRPDHAAATQRTKHRFEPSVRDACSDEAPRWRPVSPFFVDEKPPRAVAVERGAR